jgi:putative ABC transport system permease protein
MRRGDVPIARKNLLDDRLRFAVSVSGVTFAVLLILVVQSLYRGYQQELGALVDEIPADMWVAERDTNGLIYASAVSAEVIPAVLSVEGVDGAIPLYSKRITVEFDGELTDSYFIAFDMPVTSRDRFSMPVPNVGHLIIDEVFSSETGLGEGDVIRVRDEPFTVEAVRSTASAGLSRVSFMSAVDAERLIAIPGYVSFLLVSIAPDADQMAVAAAIERSIPEVRAIPSEDFAEANRQEVSGTFLPIVTVLLVVAFLVGSAVVGLTIYTATIERMKEFGVLKAIGGSMRYLSGIVLMQSVIVGFSGFLLGVPLTFGVNHLANSFVPDFITLILLRDIVTVFGAALGMAVVASIVPMHRIVRVDPADVFRG